MNISNSIPSSVESLSFYSISPDDIRRVSVKQIVNPVLLDDLNRPNAGGLYDPALGPSGHKDICATCRLQSFECPGHFGHIELPAPVYHPLFMVTMYNLLRATCLFCHRFKISRSALCKFVAKLRLLERGLLQAAQDVDDLQIRTAKGDGAEGDGNKDETVAEFRVRVGLFVAVHLHRTAATRDEYKLGLAYEARKKVIQEFIRATMKKSCANADCGAHGYTFRKEGSRKIIEYDLSIKQKQQHAISGKKRLNVLLMQGKTTPPTGHRLEEVDAMDVDEEEDPSEGEGEDVASPDEDGEESQPAPGDKVAKDAAGRVKGARGRNERVMAPEEARAHLRLLFEKEAEICSLIYGRHGPFASVTRDGLSQASADKFFLDVLPVAPTRFRPPVEMGDALFEHSHNELLTKVLTTSYRLRDLDAELRAKPSEAAAAPDRKKILESLLATLVQLQDDVNSFIDSSKNPQRMRGGKLPPPGVKQGLEKKEGLFRKHMMGKRVNFAARSVISPDVNIDPHEIGVPPVFARKLTFPEPVTAHNVVALRRLVRAGARAHPGAAAVELEDGTVQLLDNMAPEARTALANQLLTPQGGPGQNKKVYRHLHDGDMLLLNRQPTLHKPSMMAHRARVLKGEKTIRMHYANCNSYNADFDGDEMNIHFAQNQIARAEATFVANTDNQYLVPTSGKPLRGLIQDHVVAGLWMTNKETFFTRAEYHQLLYGALRPEEDWSHTGRIVTLPPTIWKPMPLWTGKQVVSTILKNLTPSNAEGLNLRSKCKIDQKLWGDYSDKSIWGKVQSEEEVIFADGDMLCGILDKSQLGASDYGLVHSVFELYGPEIAGRLLGILSRLLTKYLQHRAFTCRMDDLALTQEGDAARHALMEASHSLGHDATVNSFPSLRDLPATEQDRLLPSLLREVLRDDSKMAALDNAVKERTKNLTASIANACIPNGLLRKFPDNHMQTMTLSGAKGSAVNARQISCELGQQELEGRRVPVMISGKTLPSFKAFETAAIAGGHVASRFLTGVRPQEFYFHCMAGREGLIDTAVKTSRSGYLQRCLIKHLEGVRVHYDHTVRMSDSSVLQFHYGGDALDVTKQKHLLVAPGNPDKPDHNKRFLLYEFAVRNYLSLVNRTKPKQIVGVLNDEEAIDHMKKALKKPRKHTPTLSLYNPTGYLGATSERFARDVEEYIALNPHGLIKSKKSEPKFADKDMISAKQFRMLMNVRYMKSLVEAGEAVGLLASQGIGEPSTQMTLNTFHLAGHGAANVTLGIPRLREIIMTASPKPKTPTMQLPVKQGVPPADVEKFCKRSTKLTLSQLVETVRVTEKLALPDDGSRLKRFSVLIKLYAMEECKEAYLVKRREILNALTGTFAVQLRKDITGEMKKINSQWKSQLADIDKGKASDRQTGAREDDGGNAEADVEPAARGDDDESEIGEGDADDTKRARQSKQQATYDSDEDEEDDEDAPVADIEAEETAVMLEANAAEDDAPEKAMSPSELFKSRVGPMAAKFAFSQDSSECKFELMFGVDAPKLLLVDILERCCRRTTVREIPRISTFTRLEHEPKKNETEMKQEIFCEGSNFSGVWNSAGDLVDLTRIKSNDIFAILSTYGVEMARATIVNEISSVFGVYNIDVDRRHLELIADYMTFEGGFKPFNRSGIASNSSPLLKASFETTVAFLSDATLHGDFDDLTSPSGNIVMGRPSLTGTGVFDIRMPLQAH